MGLHVRTLVRAARREILDALFPPACVGCGRYGVRGDPEDEQWFCTPCRSRLLAVTPTCVVCGRVTHNGITCTSCRTSCPLTGVIAVGRYADSVLRSAITRLKFHGVLALAPSLGNLLTRRIVATGIVVGNSPVLVPLPIHPRRARVRGFNQARLLANVVGELLSLPVEELLVRRRHTPPQTSIVESPRRRRENVSGVFAVNSGIVQTMGGPRRQPSAQESAPPIHRVILVDDVLTTGATILEAGQVLADVGVQEIWAAVVARG